MCRPSFSEWDDDGASSLAARLPEEHRGRLAGMGAAQGLAVIGSIVAAQLLGKVTFGEFGMVTATVGTFGIVAGLGLH
jgi:hypothetical protein